MRGVVRGLFYFEALITLGSALQCFVAPGAFAGQFVARFPDGAALTFIGWLGACYVVIATLELSLLRWGDRGAWKIVLPPILIGDLLHIVAHINTLSEGGLVDLPTYASFGLTVVYGSARVLALRDLSLVAKAP